MYSTRNMKETLIHVLKEPGTLVMSEVMMSWTTTKSRLNLAGLILRIAGYHPQLDSSSPGGIRLPLNAPWLDRTWQGYDEMHIKPSKLMHQDISCLARQLWEGEYGEEEAAALPFYAARHLLELQDDSGLKYPIHYWDDLESVSAKNVVEYLTTGESYPLNKYTPVPKKK